MSVVTYNGVSLPYPLAVDFQQDVVYDDVSGTDRYLTKFDIKVQTYITSNYLSLLYPTLLNSVGDPLTINPAAIMKIVRQKLLQPRKTLSYKMNGVELLPLNQNAASSPGAATEPIIGTVDAKNGPIPQSCNIVNLTNSSFLMTFHIIAHYWENVAAPNQNVPSANQTGNNMLYNRWTESVVMDERMVSTITRTGKFVIRSDNVDGYIADQLRSQMAVVGLPFNFLRQRAEYQATPDGLGLQYTLVDREQYRLPPFPAYKAEGHISVALEAMGCMRIVECHVRLTGCYDGAKGDFRISDKARQALINAAVGLASYKVVENGFQILTGAKVSAELFEPVVDVVVQGYGIPTKATEILSPGSTKPQAIGKFTTDLLWKLDTPTMASTKFNSRQGPNSPQYGGPNTPATIGASQLAKGDTTSIYVVPWQPVYGDRGTANLLLMAASYYDPSLTNWKMNRTYGQLQQGTGANGPYGPIPGQAGKNLEA